MHFVDPQKMKSYRAGLTPDVILNHDMVAERYNVPSINLAKEVTDRIDAGEFSWENDFKNLHPSPFGQQIYYRSMKALLENAWYGTVAEDDKIISYSKVNPLDNDNYGGGILVDINHATLGKGWSILKNWKPNDGTETRANYTDVPMLIGNNTQGTLKFQFVGKAVGIAVAAGKDAGIIEYRIDNGAWQKQDLFTNWSKHLHLPWYYTLSTGLKNQKHTLRIRISENKNSQSTGTACRIRYFYVNK
jgi:sialidase-1